MSAVGADKAIQLYMDVKRIEADGGMLIMVLMIYLLLYLCFSNSIFILS